MSGIKLDGRRSFSIEREDKRLRLIVSDNGEELVCHKVSFKELNKFIQTTNGPLFKGRLQLNKKDNNVLVSVKGDMIGIIELSEFEKLVNHSDQPEQIA